MKLIDIVTIAPKSQEASLNHSNTLRQNAHMHEQAQANFANEVQHNSKQTVETEKNEWLEYQYGQSNSGNGNRQNGKRKKKEEKQEEQPEIPKSNSTFDIKI